MDPLEAIKAKVQKAEQLLLSVEPYDTACTLIKELRSTLEKLEQEAAAHVKPELEPWPKVGDKYYCCNASGIIVPPIYDDSTIDHFNKETNNCHRTPEQAIRHKEYITSPRVRARELVERCDGFDPKGNYCIVQEEMSEGPQVINLGCATGGLHFNDMGIAIDVAHKYSYLIKVALGVIVGEDAERIVCEYVGRCE